MNGPVIDWGVAEQPLPGQTESGDRCVVRAGNERAMIAVIDGLGHGNEAALASRAAVEVLEFNSDEGIVQLFQRCHERLKYTRGAAMTVARYDAAAHRIQWLGAGNVRAVLLHASSEGTVDYRDMLIYSGVVGLRLPTFELRSLEARQGDVLYLATDGIEGGFPESLRHGESPQAQADRLLASHRVYTDDALILVARIVR